MRYFNTTKKEAVEDPETRCDACRFFVPIGLDRGQCRRKSPAVRSNDYPIPLIPEVPLDHWCGEFKPLNKRSIDPDLKAQCPKCKKIYAVNRYELDNGKFCYRCAVDLVEMKGANE